MATRLKINATSLWNHKTLANRPSDCLCTEKWRKLHKIVFGELCNLPDTFTQKISSLKPSKRAALGYVQDFVFFSTEISEQRELDVVSLFQIQFASRLCNVLVILWRDIRCDPNTREEALFVCEKHLAKQMQNFRALNRCARERRKTSACCIFYAYIQFNSFFFNLLPLLCASKHQQEDGTFWMNCTRKLLLITAGKRFLRKTDFFKLRAKTY